MGLDPTILLLIIAAGVVLMIATAGGVLSIMLLFSGRETPFQTRLRDLAQYNEASTQPAEPDLHEVLIERLTPLSLKMYGANIAMIEGIRTRLTRAGLKDNDEAIHRHLASKLLGGITGCCIGFVAGFVSQQSFHLLIAFIIAGFLIGIRLPDMKLAKLAKKRQEEIRYTLPDVLDMMIVCVEAGMSMDATILRVAHETTEMAPDMSVELKRAKNELNAGLPRTEVFKSLGLRSGVEELKGLCSMIIQSDKLGSSIAETLRIYATSMRTKRRQEAEELAAKASIKMTVPLVTLILPSLFIILLGSAAINMMTMYGMIK